MILLHQCDPQETNEEQAYNLYEWANIVVPIQGYMCFATQDELEQWRAFVGLPSLNTPEEDNG